MRYKKNSLESSTSNDLLKLKFLCHVILRYAYLLILLLVFLLPLLLNHYSPLWTLDSNAVFLHSQRISCLFVNTITFKSSSTWSLRFLHGLPLCFSFSFYYSCCYLFWHSFVLYSCNIRVQIMTLLTVYIAVMIALSVR